MLICFGVSWPVSIHKLWRTKRTEGKSLVFASIILIGYVCGIFHKLFFYYDHVIYLYILNLLFVSIDICLTIYYRNKGFIRNS
ncbi:MAG: hypothetical protein FWC43_02690 [Planctomycetaceae bacterium]|nr:hypothetical protein [Planctomycetaceae bacterium]